MGWLALCLAVDITVRIVGDADFIVEIMAAIFPGAMTAILLNC